MGPEAAGCLSPPLLGPCTRFPALLKTGSECRFFVRVTTRDRKPICVTDPDKQKLKRLQARDRQRRRRARLKTEAAIPSGGTFGPGELGIADPAEAVAAWSRAVLKVPPGHPLSGQPMKLPDYGVDFLRDALAPGVREALLSTARKNSKTGICAVLALAYLVGPLSREGFRLGAACITREKVGELLRSMREIATASNLSGLDFRRSPAPGWIEGRSGATMEFLSADKASGAASGFDVSIVDEMGLMGEKDRELISGLRTATSARDGRLLALSIRGDSPMLEEMLERAELSTCVVHLHAPETDDGGDVDTADPEVWAKGNPGIKAGIKSAQWMADEVARVEATPSDRATFLALDLNLPGRPSTEVLFSLDHYRAAVVDGRELPPRKGPCVLGLDMGEAASASAAFAIWPLTGRCEAFMGFGDVPDLVTRGKADGARYDLMHAAGELWTYPGRVTPVASFVEALAAALEGGDVFSCSADGYKQSEVVDAVEAAEVSWPLVFRRVGAGKDGGRDVRALQRLFIGEKLKMRASLAFASAVRAARVRRDGNGNPGIDRAKRRGRIDLVSAAALAAGEAERIAVDLEHRPDEGAWF